MNAITACGRAATACRSRRWRVTLRDLEQQQKRHEQHIAYLDGQIRQALVQVKAHTLPGAQGEVARVLAREGWDKTPEELEEMVQMLTG